jgi:hypothetical protein
MAGVEDNLEFLNADKLLLLLVVHHGTRISGWVYFEEFARISVEVEYASEI